MAKLTAIKWAQVDVLDFIAGDHPTMTIVYRLIREESENGVMALDALVRLSELPLEMVEDACDEWAEVGGMVRFEYPDDGVVAYQLRPLKEVGELKSSLPVVKAWAAGLTKHKSSSLKELMSRKRKTSRQKEEEYSETSNSDLWDP